LANFSANLNKENLITVTVNKATVSVEGSMNFYITDERTCNIYCQLKYDASTNSLIKNQQEVDNAEDFVITMRIIKPNNEPKELEFEFLDQPAMFYVSLTDEYKDLIGPYKCELFVDCYVNGTLERITTSSFSYKINASIMNNLDSIIEKDPDYPLIDEILEQLETVDLRNYATKKYVEDAIANIKVPEIDLTAYATNESVDNKIAAIEIPDVTGYATKEYVDNIIHVIDKGNVNSEITFDDFLNGQHSYKLTGSVFDINNNIHTIQFRNELAYVSKLDLPYTKKLIIYRVRNVSFGSGMIGDGSDYIEIDYKNNTCKHEFNATQSYVDEAIAAIDTSDIDLTDYATKEYVDDAVANIDTGDINLSDYATKEDLDKAITVIDKLDIGFDDFPDGTGIYRLTGSLNIRDINGNKLTWTTECYKDLVRVGKRNSDTVKDIYFYTLDNKYIMCDIINGTITRTTYDASREYVNDKVSSATSNLVAKSEMNLALINKADKDHKHTEYATSASLTNTNTALNNKADKDHKHTEYLTEHQDISNLATKEELNTALGDIESLLKEI
jgi:hypothetical protein